MLLLGLGLLVLLALPIEERLVLLLELQLLVLLVLLLQRIGERFDPRLNTIAFLLEALLRSFEM